MPKASTPLTAFPVSHLPSKRPAAQTWPSALVACATLALTIIVWGGVNAHPVIHDELAYELQCRIFATGSWTAPPPAARQFFTQMYVLDEPRVASKYWPGHSLILTPGCIVGWPNLMPLLLAGLSGGLFYAVASRVMPTYAAVAAWLLWATCSSALEFRATYLSHSSTVALFLASLLSWHQWRYLPSRTAAVTTSSLAGLLIVVRPLTGIALAAPIFFSLGREIVRRRQLALGSAAACALFAILSLLPVWCFVTIRTLSTTPYTYYSERYFPFDRIGFHQTTEGPRPDLPNDMSAHARELSKHFEQHAARGVAETAYQRLEALQKALAPGWRLSLLPLAAFGLSSALRHPLTRMALASAVALFGAHLTFAHPPSWTAYYLEGFPAFFLLTGLGLQRLWTLYPPLRQVLAETPVRLACGVVLSVYLAMDVETARVHRSRWQSDVAAAYKAISTIERPAIVFVSLGSGWNLAHGLVRHCVNQQSCSIWIARDLGLRNQELAALAPDRALYRYETNSRRLTKIGPTDPD